MPKNIKDLISIVDCQQYGHRLTSVFGKIQKYAHTNKIVLTNRSWDVIVKRLAQLNGFDKTVLPLEVPWTDRAVDIAYLSMIQNRLSPEENQLEILFSYDIKSLIGFIQNRPDIHTELPPIIKQAYTLLTTPLDDDIIEYVFNLSKISLTQAANKIATSKYGPVLISNYDTVREYEQDKLKFKQNCNVIKHKLMPYVCYYKNGKYFFNGYSNKILLSILKIRGELETSPPDFVISRLPAYLDRGLAIADAEDIFEYLNRHVHALKQISSNIECKLLDIVDQKGLTKRMDALIKNYMLNMHSSDLDIFCWNRLLRIVDSAQSWNTCPLPYCLQPVVDKLNLETRKFFWHVLTLGIEHNHKSTLSTHPSLKSEFIADALYSLYSAQSDDGKSIFDILINIFPEKELNIKNWEAMGFETYSLIPLITNELENNTANISSHDLNIEF